MGQGSLNDNPIHNPIDFAINLVPLLYNRQLINPANIFVLGPESLDGQKSYSHILVQGWWVQSEPEDINNLPFSFYQDLTVELVVHSLEKDLNPGMGGHLKFGCQKQTSKTNLLILGFLDLRFSDELVDVVD